MKKDIYKMDLHETIQINSPNGRGITTYLVTRVAGGWIYKRQTTNNQTFVPFNNEFSEYFNL